MMNLLSRRFLLVLIIDLTSSLPWEHQKLGRLLTISQSTSIQKGILA